MKIIDVRNHNNATINMSKRVKTKPKVRASDMTRKNVVDKESADRIAAAEAMSCLSSTPFILPSSSDVVKAVTGLDNKTEPQMNSVGDHDTSTAVPKRGKSKNCGRGSKRPLAKLPQTSSSSVEGNVSEINPIVFTTTSQGSSKHSTSQSNTIKFEEVNTSSPSQASLIAQQLSNLVKMQKEKQEKADAMPSHSNIKFSLQQMLELKMAQSHVQKSQNSSNSVLKLPLMVSPVERKQTRDTVSPSSVTSSESIELTQTTVDNILNSNKYDTPEASLPLKKRRLQTYKDGEVLTTESGLPSQGVADLTTSKQDQNSKEQQGDDSKKERSSSMFVNPQTSLMLMTEIQMALHQDEDGDLPLHIAVAQENIVMVQKFVHLMTLSGKNVDKYNKSQQTPLHLAVELQFDPAVSVLLMAGANPSLVNRQGDSAVHLAVKHNTIENLALMLIKSQHKADINARNFEGLSPLHLAVIKNQIEMVKVLIRCGADINIQDGKSGRTPLFYAVEGNQLALVMLFRQCNANLELTNYAGITALMAAQAKGFSEASSVLMVGLDPKAIIEHKEKEKLMMPNKKMPIPRIPSKAHLIVSETQRGIKKENNSENDNSSQGTSHESEDVQFKLEDRSDSPQMYDKNVREIQMQREAQSETLNFERKNASPQGASEPSSLQLTINVPVKKEKSKRNKQKKTSKNDNNSSSSVEISSSLTIPMGLPKGDVNCATDVGMTKASSEVSSQSVRPAIVSNTNPGSKPVSAAENLTSINARTASLLAAHLKGAKNLLSSNKHSSSYPLNLSCDGKGSAAMETNSTAVSNGS